MTSNEIELHQTCAACPEQYDAFFKAKPVGYLRLRWGQFTVQVGDYCILTADYGDELTGIFEDEDRELHLEQAKTAIARYHTLNGL